MIRHALALAFLAACPAAAQEAVARFGPAEADTEILLRTTTDIAIFGPTVAAFTAASPGVAVVFEQWGSNDLYELTARDCAAGGPRADVVISSGVQQMVRLVNDGCAASWRSAETARVPEELRWRDQIWGISREPAVIVYNRRLLPAGAVPRTRFDLLDLMRGEDGAPPVKLATYDIEASGLGYLFAFADSQEATTFGSLLEAFARSGAVATCCSAEIIDGVADGTYTIAYNVLGSYALSQSRANPELAVVLPEDYTLILARAAILPGPVAARPAASAFLDFILSEAGRKEMAAQFLISEPDPAEGIERPGFRRLIALGPPLLIAMDDSKARQFIQRWRLAFGAAGR